jgi:hypothetical protein
VYVYIFIYMHIYIYLGTNVNGPGSGSLRIHPFDIQTDAAPRIEVQSIQTQALPGQSLSGLYIYMYIYTN